MPTIEYPVNIDSYQNLIVAKVGVSSTLSAPILANTASIPVVDATRYPAAGIVVVGNGRTGLEEQYEYVAKAGNSLVGCNSLTSETGTSQPHEIGERVELRYVALMHNQLAEAILRIQTLLGPRGVLLSGMYNVVAYGATGDGATNDRPYIQDAIDACEAGGGGTVLFPPGRYLISNTLSVGNNVTLLGVNWNAIGLSLATGQVPVDIDLVRHSVILVAFGGGGEAIAQAGIELSGSNPTICGLVFYYPLQRKPLYRWVPKFNFEVGDTMEPEATLDAWTSSNRIYEVLSVLPGAAGLSGLTAPVWNDATPNVSQTVDNGITWIYRGTKTNYAPNHDIPIAYPPTIAVKEDGSVKVPSVRHCFFINSYTSIAFTEDHNQAWIENIWSGSYRRDVWIDGSSGIARIYNMHCYPYYSNCHKLTYLSFQKDAGGENQTAVWHGHWAEENGTGYDFGYSSWVMFMHCFVYAKRAGMRLSKSENPGRSGRSVSDGTSVGCKFDHVRVGVEVESCNDVGWEFYGLHVHSGVGTNAQRRAISILPSTSFVENDDDDVPQTYWTTSNLRLVGGKLNVGGGTNAVVHQNGKLSLTDANFLVNHGSGGSHVHFYEESDPDSPDNVLLMKGCQWIPASGTALIVEDGIRGHASLIGNDLEGLDVVLEGARPLGGWRALANHGFPDDPIPTENEGNLFSVAAGNTITSTSTTEFTSNVPILANRLKIGDEVRFVARGIFSHTVTVVTLLLEVRLGADVVMSCVATSMSAVAIANKLWVMSGSFKILSSDVARGYGTFDPYGDDEINVALLDQAPTINPAVDNDFNIRAKWGTAHASNTISLRQLSVDVVRA